MTDSFYVTDLLYVTDWPYVADLHDVTELDDTHDSIKLLESDDKDDLFDLYVKVSADAVPEVDASKTYSELCTEKAKDDGYQHNAVKAEIAALRPEIQKSEADTDRVKVSSVFSSFPD